jgi:HAD superfamily hydrolase (TIGR01509 family)
MKGSELRKLEKLTQLSAGYKAFLYDCDGTLADNMLAHKLAYREAAAVYGVDLDVALIDETAGWPTVLVAAEISKRYNVSLPNTFAAEKSAIFMAKYIEQTKPITFVLEHLKKHTSQVRIGVVSGGSRNTVTKTLSVIGVIHLVEVLVCAGETPNGKPYPDPFLQAARNLGVPPSACLVFEDGTAGVQAAEAAGMKWVRVDKI